MNILEKLNGSSIAVIGLGYLGKRLYSFLETNSLKYNYRTQSFSRENIDMIKNSEFDYVFNCAGNTGDFRTRVWDTIDSNLFLTRFIIDNVKITNAFVSTSSTRVYGNSDDPHVLFSENYISTDKSNHLEIDFIYDGTKKLQESVLFNLGRTCPYKLISCRLSNIFGRYEDSDMNDSTYLKVMIKHAIQDKVLCIKQNMNSTKGFIFIDDAIVGLIYSAVNSTNSDIYNICSGISYSIYDWVKYLELDVDFIDTEDELRFSNISIQKAVQELGFQPQYFLSQLKFNKIYEGSN